jgi:hypothetical protein
MGVWGGEAPAARRSHADDDGGAPARAFCGQGLRHPSGAECQEVGVFLILLAGWRGDDLAGQKTLRCFGSGLFMTAGVASRCVV